MLKNYKIIKYKTVCKKKIQNLEKLKSAYHG